ncbi:MAG TPA: hypothetical protein VGG08_03865 [Solirubrobacteraceae bacterium]
MGLSRLGQHGGQCKEAVNIWVAAASGGVQHLGGDYLANYRAEGGFEVGRDQTVEGDIIQLNGPNGRYYYEGMHTAVIVAHTTGSNNFTVVDSNWNWHETVMKHEWNPYASAQAHGLTVHIWRMGAAGSPPGETVSGPSGNPALGPVAGLTDLDFVKTANTPGSIEVHWATAASGYQQRGGDYTSDFSPGDAGNGTWQLFGSVNGAPELGFIKTANTPGTVEVHWDVLSGGSYVRAGDYTSDFSPGDAGNGTWKLFGIAGAPPELGFIKLRNTQSSTVEVHWDVLGQSSYVRAGDSTSDFSPTDANNGSWQLGTF